MNYEEQRLDRRLEVADSAEAALRTLQSFRVQPAHFFLLKERGYSEAEIVAAYEGDASDR
jgi:hypothetical protein